MPRFRPFSFFSRHPRANSADAPRVPGRLPVLTLAERRLLLGVLFLFALGLAARALQLRAARSSPSQATQTFQPSSQPGAPP